MKIELDRVAYASAIMMTARKGKGHNHTETKRVAKKLPLTELFMRRKLKFFANFVKRSEDDLTRRVIMDHPRMFLVDISLFALSNILTVGI